MEYALTKTSGVEFAPTEELKYQSDKPVFRGEWHGGKEFIVDKISGRLATEYTPKDFQEKKVVQEIHSILYWLDQSSPQFKNWEEPVRKWAASQGLVDQNESVIPKESDNVHVPENFPKISKIQINPEKDSYGLNETIMIIPFIESKYDITQADYFANGNYLGSTKNSPWSYSLPLNQLGTDGVVEIKLKIYDKIGLSSESAITINIRD